MAFQPKDLGWLATVLIRVVSSCSEGGFVSENGVCDNEQFAGDGDDHDLERFAFGLHGLNEACEWRSHSISDKGCHVEGIAHTLS
ncbi:hypothetical protein O8B93_16285, partial [Agrobacterium rhizogenes]|uniref:hypothetical protein n=1 Tax=Rhizobium rhizogenes TaxID=359 RepID=UPI0022B66293